MFFCPQLVGGRLKKITRECTAELTAFLFTTILLSSVRKENIVSLSNERIPMETKMITRKRLSPPPLSAIASLLCYVGAASASTGPKSRRQPFTRQMHQEKMRTVEPNSFAKRHNLPIPPIISRKTRRERRAQASNQTDEELDAIIEQAKSGEDPNARLRTDLVWGTFYDRNSYPWEYAWEGDAEGNETGLPVEMDINFHRVYSVDVVNPTLDLIVWFRLEWVDPRLTWDPKEYGNHTKTRFWISDGSAGGEMSEIWTPDIELWNLDEGLHDSLEDAYAVVSYDGSVYWNRPGHLRPACKYRGLERFPFDKLECTIELGSWSYSGMYLTLAKGGSDNLGFS